MSWFIIDKLTFGTFSKFKIEVKGVGVAAILDNIHLL